MLDFNWAALTAIVASYSSLADGFIGAIVGSLISAAVVLYQTHKMLKAESVTRERDAERKERSLASALLWEIDDFYKLFVRDVLRTLKEASATEPLHVKSPIYRSFIVFEASADKVGLFDPPLVQGVLGYYGNARAYLNTMSDYGQAVELWSANVAGGRIKATTLLSQIKKSSEKMVPLTKTLCELLAVRAGTDYEFEAP
jgi:hypothetical protein